MTALKRSPVMRLKWLVVTWIWVVLCALYLAALVYTTPYVTWVQLLFAFQVVTHGWRLIGHYQTVRAIYRYLDAQEIK